MGHEWIPSLAAATTARWMNKWLPTTHLSRTAAPVPTMVTTRLDSEAMCSTSVQASLVLKISIIPGPDMTQTAAWKTKLNLVNQ